VKMKRNMISVLMLLGLWTILVAGSWVRPTFTEPAMPNDWRLPTVEELKNNWKWTETEIKKNLQVSADFNGDGLKDEAKLMIKNNGSAIGLLVVFSSRGEEKDWVLLDSGFPTAMQKYRISYKKPSVYQVSCRIRRPCLLCEKKEPCNKGIRHISIKTPTIVINDRDIFIWNKKRSSFVEILNYS
jgi:hypothetical protein